MYKKILVVLLLSANLVFVGCVPTAELYVGKYVTAAPIIQLQDATNVSGSWQTFDMTINYSYSTDGDIIELAGQGELSQHYQLVYAGVRSLRVYLFLLDADARVLETIEIPALLTSTEDKFTFNKSFRVSESFQGFSFGYRGVATDMESHEYFDRLPSNVAR